MSLGKIASRRNYARLNFNKSAGYVSSTEGLDNPLHEVHMLSTEELGKLLESGIRDLSGLTKMDKEVQDVLGIEWDSINSNYVPAGQASELSNDLEEVMKRLENLSAEERQQVLLALGDGGALDAKQASRKRRFKRMMKTATTTGNLNSWLQQQGVNSSELDTKVLKAFQSLWQSWSAAGKGTVNNPHSITSLEAAIRSDQGN